MADPAAVHSFISASGYDLFVDADGYVHERGEDDCGSEPEDWDTSPEIGREILRLSAPEAAWETVEAFHRGVDAISADQLLDLDPAGFWEPSVLLARFELDPLELLEKASPEARRHVFAECLRLGREERT
jgi:hypothetical protein